MCWRLQEVAIRRVNRPCVQAVTWKYFLGWSTAIKGAICGVFNCSSPCARWATCVLSLASGRCILVSGGSREGWMVDLDFEVQTIYDLSHIQLRSTCVVALVNSREGAMLKMEGSKATQQENIQSTEPPTTHNKSLPLTHVAKGLCFRFPLLCFPVLPPSSLCLHFLSPSPCSQPVQWVMVYHAILWYICGHRVLDLMSWCGTLRYNSTYVTNPMW